MRAVFDRKLVVFLGQNTDSCVETRCLSYVTNESFFFTHVNESSLLSHSLAWDHATVS